MRQGEQVTDSLPRDREAGSQRATHGDAYELDPRRWKALWVCLIAGFMTLLDISIVNVALPSIRIGLHAGDNELSWVVSGYALTFGLLLVPAGRIGDARGRRPSFMLGVLLFVIASMACGLAPNAVFLVIARLVQGLAGGLLTPQIVGLLQVLFSGQERARAFGMYGFTVGVSTAVGPLLGGLIIDAFGRSGGWRYIFFINLPVGAIAILLARRWIPHVKRDRAERESQDLDPVGVILVGATVGCVIVPFIEQQNWHSPVRPLLFPVAGLLLATFVAWERRYKRLGHEPVVDFALFTRVSYTAGNAIGLVYFAGFTGTFFIYTQVLQEGFGYSALLAGIATTPFALGSAVTSTLGGKVVHRLGRVLIVIGLLMVIVGLAGAYVAARQVDDRSIGWATALPLLLAGLGSGLVITPNQTLTLAEVPVHRAGIAGGVLQTTQRIGSAAGIAVTSSVFYGVLARGGKPDWDIAFRHGLLVIETFVVVSAVFAVADVARQRRT
jgi:EmrB/QacA subfamily drug resistance transporter